MAIIGVIGLGKMGRAIAERLVETDDSLVVWNRTPGRAEGLGAKETMSPAEIAAETNVILSVLADDAAVDAVYRGPDRLLSVALQGRIVVEFCTMSPERARTLEVAVGEAGGAFLECPVGGTVGPARQGQLLGLAGGSEEAFALAKPTLEKLTRRLEHVGPTGAGAAMKLAINLPLMVYWSALGEALGLAVSEGLDAPLALDILADSSGAIGAAKKRVPPIRDMVTDGEPGGVNFSIETALKDMAEMVALAEQHGLSAEVITAARARAERALQDGWAERDASLTAAFGNVRRDS
ncbi:MAG: NAD(P)-dependent oxidoreductase [Geminicoccaceae bacterium]